MYHITHAHTVTDISTQVHVQICAFNSTGGGLTITLKQLHSLSWTDANGEQKKIDVNCYEGLLQI